MPPQFSHSSSLSSSSPPSLLPLLPSFSVPPPGGYGVGGRWGWGQGRRRGGGGGAGLVGTTCCHGALGNLYPPPRRSTPAAPSSVACCWSPPVFDALDTGGAGPAVLPPRDPWFWPDLLSSPFLAAPVPHSFPPSSSCPMPPLPHPVPTLSPPHPPTPPLPHTPTLSTPLAPSPCHSYGTGSSPVRDSPSTPLRP